MIKRTFSQNVYSFFQARTDFSQNIFFQRNNWLPTTTSYSWNNPCLNELHSKDMAIWLSSKGEFCYRTTSYSAIHKIPLRNADIVLSKLLGRDIQIITKLKPIKIPKKPSKDTLATEAQLTNYTNFFPITIIYVKELSMIEKDIFAPLEPKEFFSPIFGNPSYCKNTFLPSKYLQLQFLQNHKWYYSITLQYIYYLANYQQDRFYFIMNWLAAFFKNLNNRSKTTLVFLGNKESGKEILFEEIIKPLFGQEYCLKITDLVLETTSVQKLLKNKLFYNIDNLSDSSIKDKKTRRIINDLLSKDTIDVIENKESIVEYQKYGQMIITIDEAYLTYIDKNFESYSLLKIPDELTLVENFNIEQNFSGQDFKNNNQQATDFEEYLKKLNITSKEKLIDAIKNDLTNFAFILKGYSVNLDILNDPFENDDKKYLQNNLEDKLKAFHEAILHYKNSMSYFHKIQEKNTILYEELMNDFKLNRIKQKNLIQSLSLLYPEEKITSPRTLMVQLRKTDNDFYKVANLKSGNGGIKYFELP